MSSAAAAQLDPAYLAEFIGYRLEAVAIAFIIINTCVVGLRYGSRRCQNTGFRLDDVFIGTGWLLITGLCINCICAVKYGDVGRHIEAVITHPDRLKAWLKTTFIASPSIYIVAVTIPKLAVLCIFHSVFVEKSLRIACYILGVVLILTSIVQAPIAIFQCRPVSHLWNQYIVLPPPSGSCLNYNLLFRYGSLPNIITDVVMLLLPIRTLYKLQVSMRTKIGLLATFALSSIGLITAIIRFVTFFQPTTDGPWAAVPLLIWTIVEPSVYLIAACLLSFRPLLRYVFYESRFSEIFRSMTFTGTRTGATDKSTWTGSKGTHIELKDQDTASDRNLVWSSKVNSTVQGTTADPKAPLPDGISVRREFGYSR